MSRIFSVFVFAISIFCGYSQHNITFKINGVKNVPLTIGYHYGSEVVRKYTVDLDKTGKGVFSGDTPIPGGIYLAILPDNNFFEFLMTDDREFTLETDTSHFVLAMKVIGSDDNTMFNDYQKFMLGQKKKSIDLQLRMRQNPDSAVFIRESLKKITEENTISWKKIVAAHPESFLSSIFMAMTDPEVPEKNQLDTNRNYEVEYVKNHYWDNFRFSDEKLLYTPVFYKRLDHYFTGMIKSDPDTIISEGYRFLDKLKSYPIFYRYTAGYLLNYYADYNQGNLDKVFVTFATDLFLTGKVPVDSADFSAILQQTLQMAPVMYGNVAKDISLESPDGKQYSLLETKAEYTAVFFYETDCAYCVYETPRLKSLYDKYKNKSFEVFAVYTQSDKDAWIKYINDFGLTWINTWDPENRSEYRYKFWVDETPIIYLLNNRKEIIAKKIDTAELERLLKINLGE
ncbi:MAG: hypothetical protein A2W91_01280 [Bacteroidetes bacterium GWF2_38_335]|nr:MAG: hypothetical protein A2W91_01280 [Bacteroidetes bacterium GWF2_38_335]OFY80968.1 MAG: hypothetical protein A2281_12985 [Bacteroidetes bacterium RIFOXYA12_FULL_38_20]HBS85095.1 hypothetical protein [Bacteroidales bacterium]